MALKNYDKAIISFQEAIRIQPTDITCLKALGDCFSIIEEYNLAIDSFITALNFSGANWVNTL